jgi:predicted metal-dependent peptidase
MLPLGILLWSHFAETTGELVIAGDTSGSMGAIYPVLFGEIARICEIANPEKVRIVWWDSAVCGEQVFEKQDFASIAQALKPRGGGGTEPQCVIDHIRQNDIKAKGIIWLTDGYFYGNNNLQTDIPQLWGVIDNDRFTPPQGKLVNISSLVEGV